MNQAAAAGEEALAHIAGGAMLYDASYLGQPEQAVFDLEQWRARGALQSTAGGRGTIAFIDAGPGRHWALRHYRRGGLVAKWLDDEYFWTGAAGTRGFREWRLLRRLREWQLPVPQPIAARYQRAGRLFYRADLLTVELPTRTTVALALREAPLEVGQWAAIGGCVGELHARGVHHADLNAHNLLLGAGSRVFVLDFDRGRIRARGAWERDVLGRLRRSLLKVTAGLPADRFGEQQWRELLRGAGG
jgi:3-deoxy-D-manno-octulosonic acid kinase